MPKTNRPASLENGFYRVPAGRIATVVTYLEMRAPPSLAAMPRPTSVKLEHVPAPDVSWYRDLFTRIGAADWLWFSRLRMPETELAAILRDPAIQILALMANDRPEGLLELDFREGRACELAFFGLTRAMQGRGLGRAMMHEAIRRAFRADIDRFHVHTCTLDSPVALPFYIRSGFAPLRREIEIADDPRLTGALSEDAAPDHPILRG